MASAALSSAARRLAARGRRLRPPGAAASFRTRAAASQISCSHLVHVHPPEVHPLSWAPRRPFSAAVDAAAEDEEPPLFSSMDGLHPASLHALTHKLKLSTMTEIQHKVFDAAASGRDVLGRARTGTGKTLAFLLPAIENALRLGRVPGPHRHRDRNGGRGGIATLIVSPTRELAIQIHSQAQLLAASHANTTNEEGGAHGRGFRMASQVMYGGSSRAVDLQKLEDHPPFILVATPGRLIDHMQKSHVRGIPFADVIGGVSVWVLDEADRCLDMGFRKDMEWILDVRKRFQDLAKRDGRDAEAERQTLLFSATLPKDLRSIMASHMERDYLTVDCVHDVDPASHTNANVDQSFVTLPDAGRNRWIAGLVDVIEDVIHVQNPDDYKIVVFFPTTAMCQFFSNLFTHEYKIPVLEIHSRKTQANRTSTSDKFRKWQKGILFTTDVSARGVDYPNVTHVVQYGSADSRETYIHRLGRTGRAGKKGQGILIVGGKGEEHSFVKRQLQGLDMQRDERYQKLLMGDIVAAEGDGGGGTNGALRRKEINERRLEKIHGAIQGGNPKLQRSAQNTYRSLLGYNISNMQNLGMRRKDEVVEYINGLAVQMGFDEDNLPRITPKLVGAMGLQGVRGINVGRDQRGEGGGGGGGGGRRGGGGGGYGDRRGGGRRREYGGQRGGRQQRPSGSRQQGYQQRWDSEAY
ncbi:hypothetical protein ACHAXT_005078 [Thalassiosira profunda]